MIRYFFVKNFLPHIFQKLQKNLVPQQLSQIALPLKVPRCSIVLEHERNRNSK